MYTAIPNQTTKKKNPAKIFVCTSV